MLDKATNLKINFSFKKITTGGPIANLDDKTVQDLSTDQAYGYRITMAIKTGNVPEDLANLEIGPVNHARWLTTANRLCRIYISKHGLKGKPLKNLELIVEFIVGVYYPCWFSIKINSSWIEGPRHVLYQLAQIRLQKPTVQNIVLPVVQRSSWHAFSENVIQALICSTDKEERKAGVEAILKIRKNNGNDSCGDISVREHKVPPINKDATFLTDFDLSDAFEPPLTCNLTAAQIQIFLSKPMDVPDWPCHGQSIERCVKQVTEAAATVYTFEKRDGRVKAQQAGRFLMPTNESKIDLFGLIE